MDLHEYYKKLAEQLPEGSLPENFASNVPPEVQSEFTSRLPAPEEPALTGIHAPSSYDVNISNTTVPMAGKIEMPKSFEPGTPPPPRYEVEEDAAPAPVTPPVVEKSAPTAKDGNTGDEMEAVLNPSTDNDKAVREAGMADLEKRRKLGIIPQLVAGFGDSVAMGVSAKGGNAASGSMQRLMDRQDKDITQGKADIETKLRNDANSDISKQYQALLGQFMQKDPKDPTILGMTANQIAEKIPAIEKIASLRQQEELKRLQMENTKAIKDQTASEKESRLSDELWTPMGQAKTKNDAKILKDAYTGYEGTKTNLDDLIATRKEKGAEVMDRKSVNQAKTIAADLTVQYKDLAKLGVLSKDDYRLLERLIPTDPLQFDVMAHTPAALQQARDLIDTRMNAFARGYGVTSPVKAKGDNPASDATPSASNGQRKTKSGISYSFEG